MGEIKKTLWFRLEKLTGTKGDASKVPVAFSTGTTRKMSIRPTC